MSPKKLKIACMINIASVLSRLPQPELAHWPVPLPMVVYIGLHI